MSKPRGTIDKCRIVVYFEGGQADSLTPDPRKDTAMEKQYQIMYAVLCGAASDAVDALEAGDADKARLLLKTALLVAEEMYVRGEQSA